MTVHKVMNEPKVLISETEILKRVGVLAEQMNHDYKGQELTAICILKGGVIFFSDLIRKLKMPLRCEFLRLSSYGLQTESSGEIKMTLGLSEAIINKHVLVIEDIVDTGLSLNFTLDYLKLNQPASIKTAALLFKPDALKTEKLTIDYVGFEIPNKFVVGYGLDYAEKYRELPYIGVINP